MAEKEEIVFPIVKTHRFEAIGPVVVEFEGEEINNG